MPYRKLESLKDPNESELPEPDCFLKLRNFDCDVQACLEDPRKALSYQTGECDKSYYVILMVLPCISYK